MMRVCITMLPHCWRVSGALNSVSKGVRVMTRSLAILAVALAAAAASQAQAASPIGGATMPRAVALSDPQGPRSEPTVTVAAAVARTQIEKSGYTGVRNVQRGADGTWHAVARDRGNAPVSLTLDGHGKVTQTR
jgi:hypothetical protein